MFRSAHRIMPLLAAALLAPAVLACDAPQSTDEVGEPFAEELIPGEGSGAEGGDGPDVPAPDADESDVPAPDFPADALRNMTYTIDDEPVTLVDGESHVPYMPGAASENVHILREDRVAIGDLDGNGVDDAAAIVVNAPGGSGTFIYLAAVVAGPDGPANMSTVLVGDRVQVQNIGISEGMILIVAVTHGPDDAMCCPTMEALYTYRLVDGVLEGGKIEEPPVKGIAQPEAAGGGGDGAGGGVGSVAMADPSLTETEVIDFVPTLPSDEAVEGSCWTDSLAVGRAGAYRCMVGNEIHDPCFDVDGTIVCGADPDTGEGGFALSLTEPLPESASEERPSSAWRVEIADGTVCSPMTGTAPVVGEVRANYGCDDGSYLMGDLATDTIWTALRASLDLGGSQIADSETVALRRVWR